MSISRVGKQVSCWAAVVGLVAGGVLLAGCGSPSARAGMADTRGAASGPPVNDENRVFHPGEDVEVAFTDLPTQVAPYDVKIKDDGSVTLLLNQTFILADKTPGLAEKEIRKRYVPDFYRYMTVSVRWMGQTRFYYVDGEVKMPARQTYIERTTVLKAIASASGFTDFAKQSKVVLIRLDGRKFTINCKKARNHPELDLEVYPGDKIYVPRRIF
jgi:protein involved in polysaccharide export with SLBB domain